MYPLPPYATFMCIWCPCGCFRGYVLMWAFHGCLWLLNRITLKFKCALCNVDAHFDRPGKKAGRARAGYELYSNSDDRRQGNYGREHTNADGTCRTLVEDWIAKQRMCVFLFSLSFDHQLIALSSAPAVVVLHGFDNAILLCVCVCLAEWKE